MLHEDITGKIINSFYTVHGKLSYGFLEKVYENALTIELRKQGLKVEKQKQIKVYYDSDMVGDYYADLIVDDKVIVELKAAEGLAEEHEHQLMNYLKATPIEVGMLLNFGIKPQFKRKIFTNDKKPHLHSIPLIQQPIP
jgi:GxxExxY protein